MDSNPLNLDPIWHLPSFYSRGVYEMGDTVHNYASLLYCGYQDADQDAKLALLCSSDGWPRRSPDATYWHGRAHRCSRDALTPYLIFAASRPEAGLWSPLLHCMLTHGFLFANNTIRNHVYETEAEHKLKSTPDVAWKPGWKVPDLLGPAIWAICLRGALLRTTGLLSPLKALVVPLLCILDVQGLCSATATKYARNPSQDQRNQALKVHFSATYVVTPISKLTYAIYKSTEPRRAFEAWWGKAGEPQLAPYMAKLFP